MFGSLHRTGARIPAPLRRGTADVCRGKRAAEVRRTNGLYSGVAESARIRRVRFVEPLANDALWETARGIRRPFISPFRTISYYRLELGRGSQEPTASRVPSCRQPTHIQVLEAHLLFHQGKGLPCGPRRGSGSGIFPPVSTARLDPTGRSATRQISNIHTDNSDPLSCGSGQDQNQTPETLRARDSFHRKAVNCHIQIKCSFFDQ